MYVQLRKYDNVADKLVPHLPLDLSIGYEEADRHLGPVMLDELLDYIPRIPPKILEDALDWDSRPSFWVNVPLVEV